MMEEVALFTASPAPVDLKRKHEDLEITAPDLPAAGLDTEPMSELEAVKKPEEVVAAATNGGSFDDSKAKRLRSEDKPDDGEADKMEKLDETLNDEADKPDADSTTAQSGDSQQKVVKDLEKVNDGHPPLDDHQQEEVQQLPEENAEVQEYVESHQASKFSPEENFHKEELTSHVDQLPIQANQNASRKIEIPNNKVGVVIGKGGETIRYLQINSGAKIHITKDFVADPNSPTRPVEIIGTLESIIKAEKLIKDVIAESDAGGSPALVARGFNTAQTATGEQFEIQVPNVKAGLIIGKGGETIRNLQIRSGARVQLIQESSDGEQSKEKTVRVTGNKRQIEIAREMIEELMAQPARTSSQSSSGYGSQGFRPRAPSGPSQWGTRGPPPMQPSSGHDYPRAPYQSQNQYPPSQYGGYPAQQAAPPRNSFGPSPHGGSGPLPVQGYGQGGGYNNEEARYGGQNNNSYPHQGGSYSDYPQDPYGKPPPSYGMQGQGPPSQSYGQGGMPYQVGPATAQYSQPSYYYPPYASSGGGYSQQQAPPQNAGGYHHPQQGNSQQAPPPPHNAGGYHHTQQGNGQPPVSGYVQPGLGYASYGSYPPSSHPSSGYAEPSVQSSAAAPAAYGYQATAEQSAGYSAGSYVAPQPGNYVQTTAQQQQQPGR
ncbi:far upstream element-binding protein 1-like isoform X2 [Impatiens glandulifera]|uniref:far upstream element-binding protein 1-like isoform X2 n=1 Tax=Impatiens glandulifera TaxID=253017 RepID=UPI001FB193A8|nr:far upstream element-binding protein 1-like isoform X2 [Impatiens glandulifera]